jgi:hypothetical protein
MSSSTPNEEQRASTDDEEPITCGSESESQVLLHEGDPLDIDDPELELVLGDDLDPEVWWVDEEEDGEDITPLMGMNGLDTDHDGDLDNEEIEDLTLFSVDDSEHDFYE